MKNEPNLGAFEIVTTTAGALSIRDLQSGEIMHNPIGPWAEANALYVDQANLFERLSEKSAAEFVVYDVGLGAAANALAVLFCARRIKDRPKRALRMISFERDLTLLNFARAHSDRFAHFSGFETAIDQILETGRWSDESLTWELRFGNFPDLVQEDIPPADLIMYEPYSPLKNPEMWNEATFLATRSKCTPKSLLLTYSCATPVRVALLAAGFCVGRGVALGLKQETTQASPNVSNLKDPLGAEWLGRWERSHVPNAFGATAAEFPRIKAHVLGHPQFDRAKLNPL